MRNISFALTTEQVRTRQKTVTRRTGWQTLKPGALVQPVVKGMGLKKGERVEKIGGPVRVVSVRREYLDRMLSDAAYGIEEVQREGFTGMSPMWFVEFFSRTHKCDIDAWVTRLEFEYVEEALTFPEVASE